MAKRKVTADKRRAARRKRLLVDDPRDDIERGTEASDAAADMAVDAAEKGTR